MTDREYRQDDRRDEGFCPLCAEPLSGLTVAAQGYCERHGWVSADWTPNTASGSAIDCCDSAIATGGAYHAPDCKNEGDDTP